jgi:anti-sigma regulatory factor (Ser/Thr protein kinase)
VTKGNTAGIGVEPRLHTRRRVRPWLRRGLRPLPGDATPPRSLPSLLAVSRVKVTVLSDASATSLVRSLLPAFAAAAGIHAEDARRLRTIVEGLLNFALDNAYPDDDLGEIEVTLEADEGFVHVTVHDWGLPLTSAEGDFGPLPEQLTALAPADANMQLLNLGSDGKRLVARVSVSSSGDPEARRHHIEAAARRTRMRAETPDAIEVRAATQEDAEAIAQLLYENYHLSYVHADFYRPRYLMAALASGGLVSTIALHDRRVIGHRSGRTARLCKRFRSATDLRASPGARGAVWVANTIDGTVLPARLPPRRRDEADPRRCTPSGHRGRRECGMGRKRGKRHRPASRSALGKGRGRSRGRQRPSRHRRRRGRRLGRQPPGRGHPGGQPRPAKR